MKKGKMAKRRLRKAKTLMGSESESHLSGTYLNLYTTVPDVAMPKAWICHKAAVTQSLTRTRTRTRKMV